MDSMKESVKRIGYLFYIVDPKDSSFESVDSVPDYITEVIPYFISFIVIENILCLHKGLPLIRINDAIASLSAGIFMELTKSFFKGLALMWYLYIYTNWRLCTLQWDSTSTWIITLIAVDFGFYWIHRFSHEINIFWAAHQVHHSSQEYNLTTALRQSVLHLLFQYVFYVPLALVIPPTTFLVHNQFNVLFQFWIHTQVVQTLGPLEYILNTPSHHRVHHGRNEYCIDKNYGGVLIIWDKLFGTFQKENNCIEYGLTTNINTFDPLFIQTHHYMNIFNRFINMKGIKNKLYCVLAGPGWDGGSGVDSNKANEVKELDETKFDPKISIYHKLYTLLHFTIIVLIHTNLMHSTKTLPLFRTIICSLFIFISLTSFGLIMECKKCQ